SKRASQLSSSKVPPRSFAAHVKIPSLEGWREATAVAKRRGGLVSVPDPPEVPPCPRGHVIFAPEAGLPGRSPPPPTTAGTDFPPTCHFTKISDSQCRHYDLGRRLMSCHLAHGGESHGSSSRRKNKGNR